MSEDAVTYASEANVARITLNRPERHNTLTGELVRALFVALDRAQQDPEVRVAILTGAGDADFCLGADMKEPDGFPSRALTHEIRLRDPVNPSQTWIKRIREFDKPLIAAINGCAAGGGLGLALCCDILIASENARFGCGFAFNMFSALDGVNYHLTRFLPWHKACDFAFSGEVISAQEADELGLLNKVVPHAQLMEEASKKARQIVRMAPLGLRAAKRYMWSSYQNDLEMALAHSEVLAGSIRQSEDFEEALTAFAEKRPPDFQGK
ncbi:MAG: enoyl-CoA hydratase/isomerase family protein [Deltaproteobacteria bacterium]|nr:enoyl-CoA hydratase/isomerase family protein [Deltaproteobacteria bacterium]MBW2359261.1 enoyl-CoA hydratase/isomerase family protein [Deltaproteobacteria bacterium]